MLDSHERVSLSRISQSMTKFIGWFNVMHLIDIPLKGSKFNWRRNNFKSKIDRGLSEGVWLQQFPDMSMVELVIHDLQQVVKRRNLDELEKPI